MKIDKETHLRIAQAAQHFLDSELWKYVEESVHEDLFTLFRKTKPSDTEELQRIRLTDGSVQLVTNKLTELGNHWKMHQAELTKPKPKP